MGVEIGVEYQPYYNIQHHYNVDVQHPAQPEIDESEQCGYSDDGYHCCAGIHPCGKEFMVYVVLVGKERGAVLAYAYQVHSQHIEAGDDQGRECQDCRLEVEYRIVGMGEQLYAEHAEYQSDGERPGVAHEYLGVLLHISEHVVIEEWA